LEQSVKSKNIKENIAIAIPVILVALFLTWTIYDDFSRRNEVYKFINNPSFLGEVVDKDYLRHGGRGFVWPLMSMGYTEYRLHIVGEYLYGNETVQLDRVFIVPRYLYEQFEIGDLINQ